LVYNDDGCMDELMTKLEVNDLTRFDFQFK